MNRTKPSEKLKKLAEQTGSNSACSAYLDARSLAELYEAEQEKKNAELVAELRRLADACIPFVKLVTDTYGRIPTERLSFDNWHQLVSAWQSLRNYEAKAESQKDGAKTHRLKTVNPHFSDILSGKKTAELRINDRDFAQGDTLVLCEWSDSHGYSGREITVRVASILDQHPGLVPGCVMLSFERTTEQREAELVVEKLGLRV